MVKHNSFICFVLLASPLYPLAELPILFLIKLFYYFFMKSQSKIENIKDDLPEWMKVLNKLKEQVEEGR